MPIYEYECGRCGARFERLIRDRANDVPKTCPECGAPSPVRALSAFNVSAGAAAKDSSPACSSCPSGTCPYSGTDDE